MTPSPASPHTTRVDNGDLSLALHDFGGTGDVLLIAHATGFLGRVYRAFANELTDHFRVYAMDFRAHGEADAPTTDDGFDWMHMASDVATIRAELGRRHDGVVHGFGHSMGGAALVGAERSLPGSFTSLFLFEPIIFPEGIPTAGTPLELSARARRATFESRAQALERYAARPPLGLFRADVLHDYVTHGFAPSEDGSITLRCAPEHEGNTFAMAGAIHTGLLDTVTTPTVVAVSGDGQHPAQIAPLVADALPNGTLRRFDELTHFGPLQEPVTVARHLIELSSTPTS